jgi:tRNA threonylcarbamoyladenosine biosynthesis protein TsaB
MKCLAIDTSTERMSLALQAQGQVWTHDGVGGQQSSASLIPSIMGLLRQAGVALPQLDAIAFGQGPGAFTGLRTACAVAQGLALGANLPLLPIDTLMCVAEAARGEHTRVMSVMDARMGQVYASACAWEAQAWQVVQAPMLTTAAALALPAEWSATSVVLAGNAQAAHAEGLQHLLGAGVQGLEQWPTASAMLRLAALAWQRGEAVPPELALPVYVRDQVALTTLERAAVKAASA